MNLAAGGFEPQRKSCDVRGRSTLWSLFTLEEESKHPSSTKACSSSATQHPVSVEISKSSVSRPVFESKEEDEAEEVRNESDDNEITPVIEEARVEERGEISLEIVEEEEQVDLDSVKPMKDHIDNDSQAKKSTGGGMDLREIAGSFLSAASVFSKRWNKWRQNQKLKKRNNGDISSTMPVEKPISRHYRETQSEVADYGFGRRSCDIDPRFSLDAGRISFDDPRYSFDEPRASWDGYLLGKTFPRIPPMVSVVEDAHVPSVERSDAYIPVEEPPLEEGIPGGSVQTKEFYSDSSSRRRRSLDRSNSIRKTAAAVVAEMDEMNFASNSRVPASIDYIHGTKENRDVSSKYVSDEYSQNIHFGGFKDNLSVVGNGEQKGPKKSRRWSWKIWGLIHRRNSVSKDDDEGKFNRGNGVERSLSESWQDFRREGNGEARNGVNGNMFRSNSSVSWRHSSSGGVGKLGVDTNGYRKKRGDEFVLERNRSARYSPNNVDNGLLRFYLTPLRNSWRGAPAKNRPNGSHSITRSVLRMY